MYCTGGIRCEKASALLNKGLQKYISLRGGIINYLKFKNENKEKSKWVGECFVLMIECL